jgi:riboflavin synthase
VFTGIVEGLGEVVSLDRDGDSARLVVRWPGLADGARPGDSIAVNGVCLTITRAGPGQFSADVMGETLRHSGFGTLRPGSQVNLERPLRLDGRLGGHLVQGHVDGTGAIISRSRSGNWDVVRITIPAGLSRYVIHKGSVAVDGVSLTVSAVSPDGSWFEVSLIPETLRRTTLGNKQPGETVNLETDMIAKYTERLLAAGGRRL